MTTRHLLIFLTLVALLFLNLACSEDDDPTGTGGITITDPRLEPLQAEGTALAVNILEVLPALAQGQLGNKEETEPWFDTSCTCWHWAEYDGDSSDPLQEWGRSTDFTATFFNGETPQMEFEGADRITLDLVYNYWESHFDGETKSEGNKYSSKSVIFYLSLEATGFSLGTVTVTGSGTGQVSGGTTVGEDWEGFFEEIDVAVNLTLPFIGCPAGFLDLDMEEASFSMGFNGTSIATWSYLAGPGDPLTGTFSIPCNSK
jgi:hypothetical protein